MNECQFRFYAKSTKRMNLCNNKKENYLLINIIYNNVPEAREAAEGTLVNI